jgi:hypothetical protein
MVTSVVPGKWRVKLQRPLGVTRKRWHLSASGVKRHTPLVTVSRGKIGVTPLLKPSGPDVNHLGYTDG